jgi:hypothetical protein
VVFVFASIDVLYCIYSFAYVEPSPQPWDKADLVMVLDFSDVLLDSVCHYFLRIFASMFIKEIGLYFSFFLGVFVWFWDESNIGFAE